MNKQSFGLVAAYRRRAFYAVLSGIVVTAGLVGLDHPGLSQSSPQPTSPQGGSATPGKSRRSTLRVVPIPRQNKAAQKSAAPPPAPAPGTPAPAATTPGTPPNPNVPRPGGPPITVLPGGNPGDTGAGGPDRGFRPGGRGFPAGTPFSFDFRGADIANVLKFFSEMSGLTITTDPTLTGPVTIINPKPVTLDDAFKILQSVLEVRGFTALQQGNVLSIEPLDRAIGNTSLVNPNTDTAMSDPRNMVMTQVIPLDNVDADQLATELKPLISKGASLIGSASSNALIVTDSGTNVRRFIELVNALDKTSDRTEMRVYPLKQAEAAAIADVINNLYKQISSRGRTPTGAGQPGQPGQPQMPGQPGQPGAAGAAGRPAVVAVADARTNSVIVVASPDNQEQIARDIINRLDGDDANVLDTKLRKIKYADATTVANMVNSVLSNLHGTSSSSGGTSFQNRAFGGGGGFGGFGGFFGGGGGGQSQQQTVTPSTDPFGNVTADPRTNSVLITASPDRMPKIDQLIDQLDVAVPVESTTFVFPLKNAQASDVAYALGQAFGTGNSNNGGNTIYNFGGNNSSSGGNGVNRQPIQRRLGSQNSTSGGLGRSIRSPHSLTAPPGPPNPPGDVTGDTSIQDNGGSAEPQGIPGVMTNNGFVPTNGADPSGDAQTRQFGGGRFGGFGGGQQSRALGQSTSPQYGRGQTGSYVNLLQLQNNVFVTPSPNGDSIIVTTTPDNVETLKQIIAQLDVVPRQVMIEVIVAEVTLNQDQKLGVNVSGLFSRLFNSATTGQTQVNLPIAGVAGGTTLDPAASGFQFLLNGTNYAALLQALNTDNKVRVLSTPRVFTSNNQQAEIDITTNIPYITGQVSGGLVSTTVANQVQFEQVGFILNVTPTITREGLVTINVQQEASDLLGFQTLGTGTSAIQAPEVNDRYADTSVTIQDGETVVIGGLIHENTALNIVKVPILSEIPLIGQFFRSRETTRNKVELMIFMTPHVVNSVQDARDLTTHEGAPVIIQLPDLIKQQPNLDPKHPKKPFVQPTNPTPGNPGPTTPGSSDGTTPVTPPGSSGGAAPTPPPGSGSGNTGTTPSPGN